MDFFIKCIRSFSPLTEEAEKALFDCIKTKQYGKGELIHSEGKVCKQLYFVESGLVKHFYHHEGNQYVLRFFDEGQFFIVTDSFFNDAPAEYSSMALEEALIYSLEYVDFEKLCQTHHSFETFARKLTSMVAFTAISNLKGLLYLNATERYAKFVREYGYLQQRISLGDTAGYLGISQVSLSRIRSQK